MKDMIERALSTRDKDENIMGMVTFPCNKEEVLQRFQVDDLKELYFCGPAGQPYVGSAV